MLGEIEDILTLQYIKENADPLKSMVPVNNSNNNNASITNNDKSNSNKPKSKSNMNGDKKGGSLSK